VPVSLILDTDIGSDVDDALALAFALRHPDIDLVAVTTVADDTVLRAHIATRLLEIAGRSDIPVAPGVGWETSPSGRLSAGGHEGRGLIEPDEVAPTFSDDAVSVLLEPAGAEICTIGMQSNIAAAIDRDPSFPSRVPRLTVMGGLFDERMPTSRDHNLVVDPAASMRSLNAAWPSLLIVPVDVTMKVPLPVSHLDELRDGDELSRALARLLEVFRQVNELPADRAALLHDPLCVATIVDKRFVNTERLPVRVVPRDGYVRTIVDPSGREAEVVRSADAKAFADFWLETVLGR
jgi:purine nucleosidase